jgi:flagellar assembly protein FliH
MADIFKAGKPEKDRVINPGIDPSRQLSVFEQKMVQVRREAEELRVEAEKLAGDIVAKAKGEAESIRGRAYREGVEKGKGESCAKLEELAKSLQGELERLQQSHLELVRKARTGIIDFGFKLARLIIGAEIASNPALIEKHLDRILGRLKIDGNIEICVSEEDYETIDTYMRESGFNLDSGGYEIKADPTLERGGVRVNTPTMGIDGSIDGMLKRVESVVRTMLKEDERIDAR